MLDHLIDPPCWDEKEIEDEDCPRCDGVGIWDGYQFRCEECWKSWDYDFYTDYSCG